MKKVYQSLISERKLNDVLSDDISKEKEFNKKIRWYHGRSINRKKTEALLQSKDIKAGTFLVRDSFASHGDYVLSMRVDVSKNQPVVDHFKILRNPNDCYYRLDRSKHAEIHGLENLIAFHQSEKHGLPVLLDRHIDHGPPPAESRERGRTNALHLAIQGGVQQNVINILKHKKHPDINSRDSEGTPALYMACEAGMADAVELLLRMQVKVHTKNHAGYSALHACCRTDKVDIARLLLEIGHASPVDICKHNRYSPMHTAAEEGSLECIRLLMRHGAPDRPRDSLARIPYELAKEGQRSNVVRFLDTYETVVDPVINSKDWLHEEITRAETIALFQKLGATDGIFLIRKSSKGITYALSLCFEQQIFHYEIQVMKNLVYYIDDGPMMTSFEKIVSHYVRFSDGLPCKLKTAVSPDESLVELEIFGPERDADEKAHKNPEPESEYEQVSTGEPAPPPVPSGTRPIMGSQKPKSASVKDPLSVMLIPKEHITLGHELGQGEFGSVLKGLYARGGNKRKTIPVAVKTLLESPINVSKDDFFREARVMLELSHPNVVRLIGVCEGPPVMIIQELVAMGSMLDYLWDNEDAIQEKDLILWAAQIANGMMYLEGKKFVHRDLACRNILLAEKTLAKISDFGLSRAVGTESDYYKASKGGRWPVKWYAPESVNYGTFSHASDVWSYGVTLYEMFTFGEQPYGEKSGAEVIQLLDNGYRLERPPKCPQYVYDVMKKCWSVQAASRPTFEALYNSFSHEPSFNRAKSIIGQQKKKNKFKR